MSAADFSETPYLLVEPANLSPAVISFLRSPLMVGRVKDNDIVLAGDTEVSREHCRFEWEKDSQYAKVFDLGSANGTFLNEATIKEGGNELKNGDVVVVGGAKITYFEKGPAPAEYKGVRLRHVSQRVYGAPMKPLPNEGSRTQFHDGKVLCGRCGILFEAKKATSGAKAGCPRCRAVFQIP